MIGLHVAAMLQRTNFLAFYNPFTGRPIGPTLYFKRSFLKMSRFFSPFLTVSTIGGYNDTKQPAVATTADVGHVSLLRCFSHIHMSSLALSTRFDDVYTW